MDGIDGNDNNMTQGNILALGATNEPNVLDLALSWPGRFDQTPCIPPPDTDARK